jgi:hypothetical protein
MYPLVKMQAPRDEFGGNGFARNVYELCQVIAPKLGDIVQKVEKNTSLEVAPPPNKSQLQHRNDHDVLKSSVATLASIMNDYSTKKSGQGFKQFLAGVRAMGGAENTPDYGYYGPSPSFDHGPPGTSGPVVSPTNTCPAGGPLGVTPAGAASIAGSVSDMGLAMCAAYRQHLAISKEVRMYENAPELLKQDMKTAYLALLDLFRRMVPPCARSASETLQFFSAGLNYDIVSLDWKLIKRLQYCASW